MNKKNLGEGVARIVADNSAALANQWMVLCLSSPEFRSLAPVIRSTVVAMAGLRIAATVAIDQEMRRDEFLQVCGSVFDRVVLVRMDIENAERGMNKIAPDLDTAVTRVIEEARKGLGEDK